VVLIPLCLALTGLLFWVAAGPWLPNRGLPKGKPERRAAPMPHRRPDLGDALATPKLYRRILVPLDHTATDQQALAHCATLARGSGAEVVLVHVEEDVTSQFYGEAAETAEVESGREYFDALVHSLREQGLNVRLIVRHSSNPGEEIVRVARELQPDLVVMGAHGHTGLKDVVFGTTIHSVRHQLPVPMLIVRDDG
jgi:manganese transport protein